MPALSAPLGDADSRFDAPTLRLFYRLLGATLLALPVWEWRAGRWAVNAGTLYARRWPMFGLCSTTWLAVEWSALLLCGAALALGFGRRLAARVACVFMLLSVCQAYMNQKALLFLILLYLSFAPPDPEQPGVESASWPNVALIRWQIVIVYAVSALAKLRAGYWDGLSLRALFELLPRLPEGGWLPARPMLALFAAHPSSAAALSCAVIAAELALPVLLIRRPRLGVAAVALLHASFMLFMPGLLVFSLASLTAASLFLAPRPQAVAS